MRNFTSSKSCHSHVHCVACRQDANWRESLHRAGLVDSAEFDCPWGIDAETAPAIQAEASAKLPGYNPEAAAKHKVEMAEQGRAAWAWLHEEAAAGRLTEERIEKEFLPMIPNYGCSCRQKFAEIRKRIPFREWDQEHIAWKWHDEVSKDIPGKKRITFEEAQAIWHKRS